MNKSYPKTQKGIVRVLVVGSMSKSVTKWSSQCISPE